MGTRSKAAEQAYEASGKRPGGQIALRLPDKAMKDIDRRRGLVSRAAWVKMLVDRELKRG